jgi:AcrR family transcriptional regulator
MKIALSGFAVDEEIPGVLPAKQKRSQIIRDKYLEAGCILLNEKRFSDLKIPELAAHCGNSVGSFYTRFEDKDSYFRALRSAAIGACNAEIRARVGIDQLYDMSPGEALDELVDLMADLFSGPLRGILRESLLRILEPEDPWAPMRESAREIMRNFRKAYAHELEGVTPEEAKTHLSFCFQLIVGVLQNDLVNDYHVFTTRDESLRSGLKTAVRRYMRLNGG